MDSVSFEESGCFSSLFLDYVNRKETLSPFIKDFFSKEALQDYLLDVNHRVVLVEVITDQYKNSNLGVPENLQFLLEGTTQTVTTGHQLGLFTGPLYFHYKIMSTLKLAEELSSDEAKVLPIFWMASEDHDFDEINHFHLKDKTHQWNSKQQGAVGEFELEDMKELLNSLPISFSWITKYYEESANLTDATRKIIDHLYGEKGLIILDANDSRLKSLFIPILEKELLNNTSYFQVLKSNQELRDLGYKTQVEPREINLFYKNDGLRERIVQTGDHFEVLNTDLRFTEEELLEVLRTSPERFSPNVVMRPVLQQFLLPNIAYIGGPGELAYWLQLKGVHDTYGVPFPILVPRDHILYLDKNEERRRLKLQLEERNLFQPKHEVVARLVQNSESYIDFSDELKIANEILVQVKSKLKNLDTTLEAFGEAEQRRVYKQFVRIQKKVAKTVKLKEVQQMNSLELLWEKVRPNDSLQERRLNFLEFYQTDKKFLETVFNKIDPYNLSFKIIQDE